MDIFHRLLNTVEINTVQFLWAVVPAVGLLLLWELGKLIARRVGRNPSEAPTSVR
jgi:P-type Ca2+ transporter type 2C